jgi:hypothetical protein
MPRTPWQRRAHAQVLVVATAAPPPPALVTTAPTRLPTAAAGSLQIVTSPPDATLIVDGRTLDGVTPLTVSELDPGREHLIIAQRHRYQDSQLRIALAPGERAVRELRLLQERRLGVLADASSGDAGSLVVGSKPWCEVMIDGVPVGPTPLTVRLASGHHRVRVQNSEFHIEKSVDVNIHAKQTLRQRFDFDSFSASLARQP